MNSVFNKVFLGALKVRGFERKSFMYREWPVYYVESPTPKNADKPKTVVVFPGFGDSLFSSAALLLKLSKDYRVLALDFPGYTGMSTLSPNGGQLLFDELDTVAARFFEEVVRPLGGADYLFGNSMGGWYAFRMAARYPNLVRHLVAINPAGIFTSVEEWSAISDSYQITSYSQFLKLVRRFWHRMPTYFYALSLAGFYQYTLTESFRGFPKSIRTDHFINEAASKLAMPVSLIWGTSDKLFGMHMPEALCKLNPKICLYPIERAGHIPHIERPFAFFKVFKDITQIADRLAR